MRLVIGLLAATLTGAEGPDPRQPDASMVTYQVTLLEMNGLDWRSAHHHALQPVARQGSATIWTTHRDEAAKITGNAVRVVSAPKVSCPPLANARVFQNTTRRLITEMVRPHDGPVRRAAFFGYAPKFEDASEGYSANLSGRKLDQGVLANVAIDETQITAVHPFVLEEGLKADVDAETDEATARFKVDVPEFAGSKVAGEWLIPNDGVLLVSFGARTIADPSGKAIIHERLAMVSASVSASNPGVVFPTLTPLPLPAGAGAPLPMPALAVPSRQLPQPLNANGETMSLPPLPEDHSPPTAMPGSSEPCATPQTRKGPRVEPNAPPRDDRSERTSFESEADVPCDDPQGLCPVSQGATAMKWTSVKELSQRKPFSIRVPIHPLVTLEVRAVATPVASPSSAAPAPPCVDDPKDE